jgi:multicomponent K+:H+ antiporter subunit D
MFMFGAVAMTGMPPLSGFFGKVLILGAALEHQWAGWVLAVVLVSSFLMIITLARTGSLLFYNVLPADETEPESKDNDAVNEIPNRISIIAIIGLFALSPLLVLFAQPITAFTEAAAKQQMDSKSYIESVLSKQAVEVGKE